MPQYQLVKLLASRLKYLCRWGCGPVYLLAGSRYAGISWTLRRIIRKLRSSPGRELIARPRRSCKQPMMSSKTIATAVRRISGHKMKTGKKLSITGLMDEQDEAVSMLLKRLKSLVAKLATNTVIFKPFSTGEGLTKTT